MTEETMMEKYKRYKKQLVNASIEMNCASAAEALNFFKDDEYYDDDMSFTFDYILSEIVYYYILGYERYYSMVRNMPAGEKPADIAFIPINTGDAPLLIVDVGLDSSVDAVLRSMIEDGHAKCLNRYSGKVVLMAINFDSKQKTYTCAFESVNRRPAPI